MKKNYDGWAIKYSWGWIDTGTVKETRTQVVKAWNDNFYPHETSMLWKNAGRRFSHKIVRVKIVEVSDE